MGSSQDLQTSISRKRADLELLFFHSDVLELRPQATCKFSEKSLEPFSRSWRQRNKERNKDSHILLTEKTVKNQFSIQTTIFESQISPLPDVQI